MSPATPAQAATPLEWIDSRPVPIDHGGPVDIDYRPLSRDPRELQGIQPIERIVELYPDKLAVDDGNVSLSYSELLDRVYDLAARIDAAVAKGAVVASLVGSTAAAPIIVMACVAAARPLVPLDSSHPLERQRAIFAESGATALITEDGVAVDDSYVPVELPRIGVDPKRVTGAPRFTTEYDPDAVMFVIFTSGSTGRPKGLPYANRRARTMADSVDTFHINPSDVIIGLGSLSVGGARDAFLALTTGATVRLVDVKKAGLMEVLRVLGEEGVTFMSFVPSFIRMLFSIPGIDKSLRHLRILDLHGERTLAADMALLREKLPASCKVSITYGASETGFVTSWFVQDDMIDGPIVPVGYLVPGKRVAVVGEDGAPALPGEVGELMVAGEMAAGGWQAGKLTGGRFLPDPDRPGERIYPMGDLVRMRPDGLFEYVGRSDRRIKVHGLWADLGEVETALRACGGVADAVVIAREVAGEGDRIIAFITPDDPGHIPASGALRRAVAEATAEHMVPTEIRVLECIPRLANYKPDLVRLQGIAARTAT